MNVKIINKIHIVIVRVLSVVMQHGNHSSGSAAFLLDAERPGGPAALSSEMFLLNMLGGPGKYSLI